MQPGAYCVSVNSVRSEDMAATVQVSRPDQPTLLVEGVDTRLAACTADTEARPLSADGPLDGKTTYSVDAEGTETSYLRFSLAQPTSLTLRAQSADLDPFMRLFDAQGTVLGENDDADGTDFRLDFPSALPAGDYCIGVAALSPGNTPISVSAAPLDRDSFLRAAYRRGELLPPMDGSYPVEALDLSATQPTVILHDGGAHWTRFDLDTETVVIVDAYGSIVGADPKLVLYAATGQPVADNDDYNGSTNARLGPVLLQPGQYALAVLDVNRSEEAGGVVKPIGMMVQRFQRVE